MLCRLRIIDALAGDSAVLDAEAVQGILAAVPPSGPPPLAPLADEDVVRAPVVGAALESERQARQRQQQITQQLRESHVRCTCNLQEQVATCRLYVNGVLQSLGSDKGLTSSDIENPRN